MHAFLKAGIVALAMAAMPIAGQAGTLEGVAIGAGAGAVVAGPPGAVVGGVIGAVTGGPNLVRRGYRRCWTGRDGYRHCRR
jgi:osmotically inducible lipoprotein OsmB